MPASDLQWWSTLGQWAGATGTLLAVVAALFGDRIRKAIYPPLLKLTLKNQAGEKTPVNLGERTTVGRWYHGRVENARRWSPASQVQVFLLQLEEKSADGGMHVTWTGEIPVRWKHQEASPAARPFGHPFDFDLCSVVKDKWVEIHPIVLPFNLNSRHRTASSMVATFQARGIESDSNLLRVSIAWDGGWSDDAEEMKRHMVVKEA